MSKNKNYILICKHIQFIKRSGKSGPLTQKTLEKLEQAKRAMEQAA